MKLVWLSRSMILPPLIITISDTCKTHPKRLDSDNTINLSSLIVSLDYLSLPSLIPIVRFLNLSGCPVSRDLMREGVEVSGVGWSSGEDPVPEETPLNLVLYMHFRIFTYSSNILIDNFERCAEGSVEWFVLVLHPALGRDEILVCDVTHSLEF